MDFFDLLKMVGGLALFLYGMNLLGDGLSHRFSMLPLPHTGWW